MQFVQSKENYICLSCRDQRFQDTKQLSFVILHNFGLGLKANLCFKRIYSAIYYQEFRWNDSSKNNTQTTKQSLSMCVNVEKFSSVQIFIHRLCNRMTLLPWHSNNFRQKKYFTHFARTRKIFRKRIF